MMLNKTTMKEFLHLVDVSEVYPRFKRDFAGFTNRFKTVTGKLEELRNLELENELEELESLLNKPIQVITVSKECVDLKRYINSIKKVIRHNSEDQVDYGVSIVMGYIKIDNKEQNQKDVSDVCNYLKSPQIREKTSNDNIYLFCEMDKRYTQNEADAFGEDIKRTFSMEKKVPYHQVIVASSDEFQKDVQKENIISKNLEYKIIQTLDKARTYLKLFIRLKRPHKMYDKNKLCIEVYQRIKNINTRSKKEFLDITAKSISSILSDAYLLTPEACKCVFEESDFVRILMTHLRNVEQIVPTSVLDHITMYIKDLEEKVIKVVETIRLFRLMVLEIDGYIRKSYYCSNYEHAPLVEVPQELRQELIKIKNIKGVGLITGILYIDIDSMSSETDVENIESEAFRCCERHRYNGIYQVRKISSLYQRMASLICGDGIRVNNTFGTLGLIVKGSDESLYGLTAAHVAKDASSGMVFKSDRSNEELIGFVCSMPYKSFLTDIAVIKLSENEKMTYELGVKDLNGKIKEVKCIDTDINDLCGSVVFKHGAVSGFTKGIISSSKYCVSDTCDMILISSLPGEMPSMYEYLVPGDSGSVTCLFSSMDNDVIEVLSMNMGQLTDGEYVSIPLQKGLARLEYLHNLHFKVS